METIKKFDSVKMMRETREKLSVKYWKNPEVLMKDLEEIRKKYKEYNWPSVSKDY